MTLRCTPYVAPARFGWEGKGGIHPVSGYERGVIAWERVPH